jgi:hypothetical protein
LSRSPEISELSQKGENAAFDVLPCIADHPAARLHDLLPWHWEKSDIQAAVA